MICWQASGNSDGHWPDTENGKYSIEILLVDILTIEEHVFDTNAGK